MILQNIWGRVVGNVVINISPSNIFQKMLLIEKYIQNCQACFGLSECEWDKPFMPVAVKVAWQL